MRVVLTAFFVLFTFVMCAAQGEDNSLEGVPFNERIIPGGGIGLGFTSTQSYFSISPSIGYMLTKKLIPGVGITYAYTKSKLFQPALSVNQYGVNPFLRYYVYQNIFIHSEYEYLIYDFKMGTEKARRGYNSLFAGGGFTRSLGGKLSFNVMVLYNFLYAEPGPNEFTPYPNPIVVRFGVNIGSLLDF